MPPRCTPPSQLPDAPAARRAPAQQRSRERQERILQAARELIAETGSDRVKMNEVAERAGISIGSLYQYFPDKQAIVRTLAEHYTAETYRCVEMALVGVQDIDGLLAAYATLVDQYHALFLAEPVMRDISHAMQSDKQLEAVVMAECMASGNLLAEALQRAHPRGDPKVLKSTALLIWQLGESTMRLAVAQSRAEGARLVEAYKRMTLRAIAQP